MADGARGRDGLERQIGPTALLFTGISGIVGSGWLFASSSLYVPMEVIGQKGFKLKLAWMYLSLYVGLILLLVVNVELILRALVRMLGGEERLRPQIHAELTAE